MQEFSPNKGAPPRLSSIASAPPPVDRTLATVPHLCTYELVMVSLMAAGMFYLQARHLGVAVAVETDEGVYALAGRMLFSGHIPHRDFPLFHMPLLPFLLGAGLRIFGTMYPARLIYLSLNCLAAILLYVVLRCLPAMRSKLASLVGVIFYFAYHEMLFHDFRFVAIRQLVNVLFICFLLLGLSQVSSKIRFTLQAVIAVLLAMLFLPALMNVLFASLALVFAKIRHTERLQAFKAYALMGLIVAAILALYFLAVPNSFQQVVLDQMQRSGGDRFQRVLWIRTLHFDIFFYTVSVISLSSAVLFMKRIRSFSAMALGIIISNTLLSSAFFPHYLVIAGPAFAIGFFALRNK
jgi:hypothetical protein